MANPTKGKYVHANSLIGQQGVNLIASIVSEMGMYVPKSLELTCVDVEQPARVLAQEILALTKMNWNNTQFDSALPITIKAARQVGAILKYVESTAPIQASYAFYM